MTSGTHHVFVEPGDRAELSQQSVGGVVITYGDLALYFSGLGQVLDLAESLLEQAQRAAEREADDDA